MSVYPFRLLSTGSNSGFYNMGLDETLLEAVLRLQKLK
jgi:hypothetical protein